MQALNISLFHWLAAGPSSNAHLIAFAALVAEGSSWLCFALMGWVAWRRPAQRAYLMATLFAAAAAALAAHALANAIHLPRPFMQGLGPSYIAHGARGSLPSAHASVMFTVALVLGLRPALRRLAGGIFAIALVTGWARVYVGVHFPLDIAAGLLLAIVLAACFAALALAVRRRVIPLIRRDDARKPPIGPTAPRA